MRDFFDLHALASRLSFDGERVASAIVSTFARRETEIPAEAPIALTPAFAAVEGKGAQWKGFLRRIRADEGSVPLKETIEEVATFIRPVLEALARHTPFGAKWPPGGPWTCGK